MESNNKEFRDGQSATNDNAAVNATDDARDITSGALFSEDFEFEGTDDFGGDDFGGVTADENIESILTKDNNSSISAGLNESSDAFDDFDDFSIVEEPGLTDSELEGIVSKIPAVNTDISSVETVLDIDISDFMAEAIDDDFDNQDQDEKTITILTNKLSEYGYNDLQQCTLNELEALDERTRYDCILLSNGRYMKHYTAREDQMRRYVNELHSQINTQVAIVANSKATLASQGENASDSTDFRTNNAFVYSGNSKLKKIIEQYVTSLVSVHMSDDVEIDPDTIVQEIIQKAEISDMDSLETQRDIRNYVTEVVPRIKESNRIKDERFTRGQLHRRKLASFLLRHELKYVEEIIRESQDGCNIWFVKQIVRDTANRYHWVCPECGKKHLIDHAPIVFVISDTEHVRGNNFLLPILYKGDCGHSVIFTPEEYARMGRELEQKYSTTIGNISAYESTFSEGSACLEYKPAFSRFAETVSYLIRGSEISATIGSNSVERSSTLLSVNDSEMLAAANEFYNSFKFLKDVNSAGGYCGDKPVYRKTHSPFRDEMNRATEQSGRVNIIDASNFAAESQLSTDSNYDLLARHICNYTSRDYEQTRMKAIFSLIDDLQNNIVFREYVDSTDIIRLRNIVKYAEKVAVKTGHFGTERRSVLLETIGCIPGAIESLKDDSDIEDIIRVLRDNLDVLREKLALKEEKHDELVKILLEFTEEMGHTEILNISSMPKSILIGYFSDPVLLSWIDAVADRMIVNNYAVDFYKKWINLNVVNRSTLNNSLEINANSSEALSKIQKIFEKKFKNVSSTILHLDEIFNFNDAAFDSFAKLSNALISGNIYRIYKACKYLDISRYNRTGKYDKSDIFIEVGALKEKADTLDNVSELQFFFKATADSLTGEILTDEEILEYESQLLNLNLSNFRIKRIPGESVTEYIERFSEIEKSGRPSEYKVYMDEELEYASMMLATVYCLGKPYLLEHEVYSIGAFMSKFCFAIAKTGDFSCLGMPDAIMNLLKQNTKTELLEEVNTEYLADLVSLFNNMLLDETADVVDLKYSELGQELVFLNDKIKVKLGTSFCDQFLDKLLDTMEAWADAGKLIPQEAFDQLISIFTVDSFIEKTKTVLS